jgi:hypothetical protein
MNTNDKNSVSPTLFDTTQSSTVEIEGEYRAPNTMDAKITLAPGFGETSKTLLMTCGEYFKDVTDDGNREFDSDFMCYHFRIAESDSSSYPLASIKRYNDADITLIERFNMFFYIKDIKTACFKTMIEKHDYKTVVKGNTSTDRYSSINVPLTMDMFKMEKCRSPFDIASINVFNNFLYTYAKTQSDKSKYTFDGYPSNLPTVNVCYNDDGNVSSITASCNTKNCCERVGINYDIDGNESVLRLPNNTTIFVNSISYMYNTSTTIVKFDSAKTPESTSVLTSGSIGFINSDGFRPNSAAMNTFRRKDMATLTNKIINDIPSDILSHIFEEGSGRILAVIHISIDGMNYYHVHYDSDDMGGRMWPFAPYGGPRVSYDAVYENIQDTLNYRSYSYDENDGDHIFVEEYYTSFYLYENPSPEYKITHTWNDDHSKTIIDLDFDKIEREVTYTDKSDRSKMKFKIKVDSRQCNYIAICKAFDEMMNGKFDPIEYLKAVDINIETYRKNMFVVDPEEFYDFYSMLIDLVTIPMLTTPSKKRRPPECVIETSSIAKRYDNAMKHKIDTLLDPKNAFNWIGWFNDYKRMRLINPASTYTNNLFDSIDFKSFILPNEEAAAILKKFKEQEEMFRESIGGIETIDTKLAKEGDDESDGNVT